MGAEKTGVQAALEAADLGEPPSDHSDEGGQAELFGVLPLTPAAAPVAAAGTRRPGRPVGAKNKRTEEWASYLLSKYRSPLEVLAETYSRSVDDLRRELKCSRLDAAKMQQAAALGLAPYLHQRQPQAVELGEDGAITLIIGKVEAPGALDGGALEMDLIDGEESEGFQEVSQSEPAKSDGEKSDGEAKPLNAHDKAQE